MRCALARQESRGLHYSRDYPRDACPRRATRCSTADPASAARSRVRAAAAADVSRVRSSRPRRCAPSRRAPLAAPSLMERAGPRRAPTPRAASPRDTGAPILVVAGPGQQRRRRVGRGGRSWREAFHRVVVLDATGTAPQGGRGARRAGALRTRAAARSCARGPTPSRPRSSSTDCSASASTRDVDAPYRRASSRGSTRAACRCSRSTCRAGSTRRPASRAAPRCARRAPSPSSRTRSGLHTADGLDCRGELELDDLGAGDEAAREARGIAARRRSCVRAWLAPRARNSHKGHFGTLAIIGGNRGMVGAALLAARAGAALRRGQGARGPARARRAGGRSRAPRADARAPSTTRSRRDVHRRGPGRGPVALGDLGLDVRAHRAARRSSPRAKPLVLDADALNAIAFNDALRHRRSPRSARRRRSSRRIPAEAARLLGTRDRRGAGAIASRAALELAQRFHAHVVLKGAGSICAFPDGRWSVNATGNPGPRERRHAATCSPESSAPCSPEARPRRSALQYAVCLHGAAADALRRARRRARSGSPPPRSPSKRAPAESWTATP